MMAIFSIFATPLGYALEFICRYLPNYLLAILVFTFLVKLLLFPVNISNQKNAAARARLAPRLERIQKKYAGDRQKLMEKQQALYDKEGVKMTAGCLPQILQMLVLFSIIAVIYKPLTYVERIEQADINTGIAVVEKYVTELPANDPFYMDAEKAQQNFNENSYYRELHMLRHVDACGEDITKALVDSGKTQADAEALVASMKDTEEDFNILGISLLGIPNETGIVPNWLWLIAILSGASAMLTSIQSMRHQKLTMPETQQQPGCTKWMMYSMPLMSLAFSFVVPAGVAVYWIFSNLLALLQTVILNKMYDPVKIRAEAEAEYQERRRRKAEDRERLKQARLEEQRAWQMEENEKKAQKQGKKPVKPVAETPEDGKEENHDE